MNAYAAMQISSSWEDTSTTTIMSAINANTDTETITAINSFRKSARNNTETGMSTIPAATVAKRNLAKIATRAEER